MVPGTNDNPMQAIFATCDHQPLIARDDQPLAAALSARGVEVTPIPWTEIDPYAILDAPPMLLRSTWDYHRKPTMFRSWLDAVADSGRVMWNAPQVARDNIDKIYLHALEAAGIAIPKTRWLDRVDPVTLDRALEEEGWDRAVLKPRIAATAYGTFLITRGSTLSDADLAPARASGALLQEVVPEVVEQGETSIVYIGGAFSHAVQKRAKDGEFRVQQDFGGRVEAVAPTAEMTAFAARVMTFVPPRCLYARVDVVRSSRGPMLMELELIEPELYFLIVPEAADRMARILVDQLQP